jgi:hypothetical protein
MELVSAQRRNGFVKRKSAQTFWLAVVIVCLLPVLPAGRVGSEDNPPPLAVSSLEQVIIIDRLIADRAYVNIKAGRPADHGIDFTLLDQTMEKYRPELEKFDQAYYGVLRQTYERMKAHVTDPQSDFVRAVRNPGSVEFAGRSPLPAAAFEDNANRDQNVKPSTQSAEKMKSGSGRELDELEEFLSAQAKKKLSDIRKMPKSTAAERQAKLKEIEKESVAWGKHNDRLEAAVMLKILKGMQTQFPTASTQLDIDTGELSDGFTPEMRDGRVSPPKAIRSESQRRVP